MEYKREIQVKKENIGTGEERHLNGKCSYSRVFNEFINDAVLCNNITDVDPSIFENQLTGFASWDELYSEKLEELKEEYNEKIVDGLGLTSEQIQDGFKTLHELEEEAEEYADTEQYDYEFYQYYIIEPKWHGVIDFLEGCNQKTLQIMYSDVLDCYILGVGHWGTGWDYVGSDFDLVVIE